MAPPPSNPARTFGLIVAILLIMWLLNPSRAEHVAKLGTVGTPTMPPPEQRAEGVTTMIAPVDVVYHNYVVCSTGSRADGGVVSFGILHTVIDLR